MSCMCLYTLQDEPGESESVLNCTQIPRRRPCLRDFQQAWPANSTGGFYHFRFRIPDEECGFVWQDITNREGL